MAQVEVPRGANGKHLLKGTREAELDGVASKYAAHSDIRPTRFVTHATAQAARDPETRQAAVPAAAANSGAPPKQVWELHQTNHD